MTRTIFFCLCFLILSCLAGKTAGQEFYDFRKYTQNEGLSSYNITKILKDKFGFIWIATQDGLNRFDGIRFLVFNKDLPATQRINGNNIMDMTEDRDRNCIWLLTPYGGVDRISTTTQAIAPLTDSDAINLRFKDKWLHAITVVGHVLWVGTYEGLLAYDLDAHRFLPLTNPGLPPSAMRVNKIMHDPSGRVWACCDGQGLFVFDGHTHLPLYHLSANELDLYHLRKPLVFWNIAYSGDRRVALATSWGLRLLRIVRTRSGDGLRMSDNAAFRDESFSCAFDPAGNTWYSDVYGLYKIAGATSPITKVLENTNANDSWQSSIYALYAGDSSFVWVGSEEGLAYFKPQEHAFAKYYKSYSTPVKIQHSFSICPDGDSIIWCGAANGLYRVNTHTYTIDKLDNGPSCYLIDHLPGTRLLVSNSTGCYILEDSRLYPAATVYPELGILRGDLLCCFNRYNDSLFLLGSELHRGLYVWNLRSHQVRSFNSANSDLRLDEGTINSLFKDRAGDVWVISEKSLCLFDPRTGVAKSFRIHVPGSATEAQILFDMCQTGDSYWIAAYGMGLIETDRQMHVKRVISQQKGLSNNGVYRVFSVGDSLVMVTTNNGLSMLNIRTGSIKRYYEVDGLQSNSFEQFCGYQQGGVLYAGGVNGITAIHPRNLTANAIPPLLYYTRASMKSDAGASDTSDLGLHALVIPSDVYQTTISFAGLNFSDPQRTGYAYRIREFGADWLDLGSQNFINLIGINPGRYTLETRAANEDGIWTAAPISLSLEFLPKWYQTLWFKLAIVVALAGLFYGLYRYRIAQFRQQQKIRREIANDLHDDLGSTLSTVKMLTQVARRSAEKETHFDQIEHSIAIASSGLRDLIWVLDDARDSVKHLLDRARTLLLPIAVASNIQLKLDIDEDSEEFTLTKSEKRNLLMVIKEAVNNSIKYANCSIITIQVRPAGKKLLLSISDDGKGFDTALATDGNGLKNIRYRARQIHYALDIRSADGKGTVVELTQS